MLPLWQLLLLAVALAAISICLWLIRCHVGMHLSAPVSCVAGCRLPVAGCHCCWHKKCRALEWIFGLCFGCLSIYWSVCLLIGFL